MQHPDRFYLSARQRLPELVLGLVGAAVLAVPAPAGAVISVLAGLWWFIAGSRWFTGVREDGLVVNRLRRRVLGWESLGGLRVEALGRVRAVVATDPRGRRVRLVGLEDSPWRPHPDFDGAARRVLDAAHAHGVPTSDAREPDAAAD